MIEGWWRWRADQQGPTKQEKESLMRCCSVHLCKVEKRTPWSKLDGATEISSSNP